MTQIGSQLQFSVDPQLQFVLTHQLHGAFPVFRQDSRTAGIAGPVNAVQSKISRRTDILFFLEYALYRHITEAFKTSEVLYPGTGFQAIFVNIQHDPGWPWPRADCRTA